MLIIWQHILQNQAQKMTPHPAFAAPPSMTLVLKFEKQPSATTIQRP